VAINGAGCRAGTCAYGNPQSTTAIASETAALSSTGTKATSSWAPSTGNPSCSAFDDGGLSRSGKIALGCGIGVGLPATLVILFMCVKHLRSR
jgi:hypothetical protein